MRWYPYHSVDFTINTATTYYLKLFKYVYYFIKYEIVMTDFYYYVSLISTSHFLLFTQCEAYNMDRGMFTNQND